MMMFNKPFLPTWLDLEGNEKKVNIPPQTLDPLPLIIEKSVSFIQDKGLVN